MTKRVWTFYFDHEGSVRTEAANDEEDARLAKITELGHTAMGEFVKIGSENARIFVDLTKVKVITRELVEEKAEDINSAVIEVLDGQEESA